MAVTLNGHTYDATDFTDYGYAAVDPQTGLPRFPNGIFTDFLAELASADTVYSVSPGAAGAVLYSNGSAWVRSASPTLSGLSVNGHIFIEDNLLIVRDDAHDISVVLGGADSNALIRAFDSTVNELRTMVLSATSFTFLNGAVVIGTDPGGSQVLRTSGNVIFTNSSTSAEATIYGLGQAALLSLVAGGVRQYSIRALADGSCDIADITASAQRLIIDSSGGVTIPGAITASGGITGNVTGNVSGSAATVTSASQSAITTLSNLVTVGALNSGSITSGFGSINIGTDALTCGALTAGGNVSLGTDGSSLLGFFGGGGAGLQAATGSYTSSLKDVVQSIVAALVAYGMINDSTSP